MVRNRDKGVVLLLVLMVTSILVMLIGQFSYGSFLEGALVKNEVKDAQASMDVKSGIVILKRAIETGEASPVTVELPSGTLTIQWEAESGKLNLNNLRTENVTMETARLERLFEILENRKIVQVLGLADRIADFVLSSERPILSLGELLRITDMTPEVLEAIKPFVTVYSDGRLCLDVARDEVVFSLDERMNTSSEAEAFRQAARDSKAKAPSWMKGVARKLTRFFSKSVSSWSARMRLEGEFVSREYEVALRRVGEELRVVLFNEREAQIEGMEL